MLHISTHYYIFRHQAAVLRKFIKNTDSLSPTRTSGASQPHFRHKKLRSPKIFKFWITHVNKSILLQ